MEELQLEVVTGAPSAPPLIEDRQSLVDFAHQVGRAFTAGITRDEQKAAGQFMTPPKEDERRVTCAPYLGTLPGAVIGLENHLNYIHRPGGRMSNSEVRGLSALLASSVVDRHLRAIAGSTQINAGELRSLPLPSMNAIEAIGCRVPEFPTLEEIDAAVEAELGLSAASRKVAA